MAIHKKHRLHQLALWPLGLSLAMALALPAQAQAQQLPPGAEAEAPLLRFADFFQQPLGSKGLAISQVLQHADGHSVRLTGYMVQQETPATGHFMLTPRPVRMSEHADGDADDLPAAWAMVYLDASQQDFAVPYQRGLLELSGVLHVGRLEEQDGRVSWVRLQLGSAATRGMNAFEVANYLHSLQHLH
jgi:hypothetical protein